MKEETEGRRPNPVDMHVGGRVRMRRKLMGVSQEQLAESLGLTFQQVQKYERGANRVSASKLYEIARTLQVPVSFFFDGLADPMSGAEVDDATRHAEKVVQEFLTTPGWSWPRCFRASVAAASVARFSTWCARWPTKPRARPKV
jgi:transcriptional regulator with XRE-family HTH domain